MFSCVISGLPVNTNCQQVSEDKWIFPRLVLKAGPQHLAVFVANPGQLPVGYAFTLHLQFHADPTLQWRYLGAALGVGKESAIFKVAIPDGIQPVATGFLEASLGVSMVHGGGIPESLATVASSATQQSRTDYALQVARKLLKNFVNYAFSYCRTLDGTTIIPAQVITEWYNNTLRRSQADPEGFLARLLRAEDDD